MIKRYKCIGEGAFCISYDEEGKWVEYKQCILEVVKYKTEMKQILQDIKDEDIQERIIKCLESYFEEVRL